MSSVTNTDQTKHIKQHKPAYKHAWRWFIGMYIVSLVILGGFHVLSHWFTGWLNSL